ncbi:MAG TPA: hypothetical protein VHD62_12725 [Opitutaceae bacterium]|nr:hypothetical protein [Opitutaceae bacterium]
MKTLRPVLLGFGFAALGLLQAQTPPRAPVNHDFDFWIGEWTVTTPDGKTAGENRIEAIAGGRGLLENWTGVDGSSGKSLNTFNAGRRQWQQFWVGSGGAVLELAGGLEGGGRMVLVGHGSMQPGTLHRIAWTPNADGSVRQLWESSNDDGKTWQTLFDGLYRRKASSAPAHS